MKKFIFSKVEGLESATLLKLNFFIGYFQGFYCKFYLAAFRTAIFKCNFFSRNTSTSCFLRMLNIQISLLYHEFGKVQKHQESSFYIHFDLIRVRLLVHSNIKSMTFLACRATLYGCFSTNTFGHHRCTSNHNTQFLATLEVMLRYLSLWECNLSFQFYIPKGMVLY